MPRRNLRVGVYVDVANIALNGGYGMRYDVLRDFACRDDAIPIRLNAYLSYDPQRARQDSSYEGGQRRFHDKLREQGFKVIKKETKWYKDESGGLIAKANADLDLAVDVLLQSENLDRVLLVTGDGDFIQVVNALQNRGCRVEIVAFFNVSKELRNTCDMFFSGYLIPDLLPFSDKNDKNWGVSGSKVRGLCYYYDLQRDFGFFRFLEEIDTELWHIDARMENSPYKTAFFRGDEIKERDILEKLPSRDIIFEFQLEDPDRNHPDQFKATNIDLVVKL